MSRAVHRFCAALVVLAALGCSSATKRGSGSATSQTARNATTREESGVDPEALCNAVRTSPEVPLYCSFEVFAGNPNMIVGTPNAETFEATLPAVLERLVLPFCTMQNENDEPGGVVFVVANRGARRLNCADAQLSDWVDISQEEALAFSIGSVCETVSRLNLGVECRAGEFEGTRVMLLSYDWGSKADQLTRDINETVAVPFCQSVAELNAPGMIILVRGGVEGRAFDCGTGEFGPWTPLKLRNEPAGHSKPHPSTAHARQAGSTADRSQRATAPRKDPPAKSPPKDPPTQPPKKWKGVVVVEMP